MESTPNTTPREIRRVAMACTNCRESKTKCRAISTQETRCENCVKKNLVCMYLPVAASSDLIDRRSRGPGTQSSPSTSVSPEHHYSVFNANQMNSNQMGTVPPQQAAYWYTQDGGNTANPQLGQYGYNQLQSAGHPQYGTMPYPMAAPQPSLYSPYASTSTWANQPYYTSAPQATYATETVPGNCSSGNYSQYGQDQITSAIWTDHTNEYHQTCGNISRGYDGSSAEINHPESLADDAESER